MLLAVMMAEVECLQRGDWKCLGAVDIYNNTGVIMIITTVD